MKGKFYTTKGVNDSLDMKLVINIQILISSMEVVKDYIQVFEIKGDMLIHTQEKPKYRKEYRLNKKYRDDKLFCIRTDEENTSYWTLMFACEY